MQTPPQPDDDAPPPLSSMHRAVLRNTSPAGVHMSCGYSNGSPTVTPTDQPVTRNHHWLCIRDIAAGTWLVDCYHPGPPLQHMASACCVVDDFGALQPLSSAAAQANARWHASRLDGIEPAAWAQLRAQDDADLRHSQARRLAQQTRNLLCPGRVTAEIVTEPADPWWCVASIVISHQPQSWLAPHYSVHLPGQESIVISHAQLCALMLAGQQLCRQAPTSPASTAALQ